MEVIGDRDDRPGPAGGTVVTIGAFDGVHLGHQALLARLGQRGRAAGLASAAVTFDRHPATVVRPQSAPKLLTDLDQKLELLAERGLDYVLVITFDRSRSEESAEDFVARTLVGRLRARHVVVGEDFHFGHGRQGDVALLADCGRHLGFEVEEVSLAGCPAPHPDDPVAPGPGVVSSSRVRRLVASGQVNQAARLLGRPYEMRGVVTRGDARAGPLLGFPTANVAVPPEILLPADGVYAGCYQRPGGSVHGGAISIGHRPTFHRPDAPTVVEVHLLDGFSADLYGEAARVRVLERLGDQQRFLAVEDLVAQIGRDVEAARSALRGSHWRP